MQSEANDATWRTSSTIEYIDETYEHWRNVRRRLLNVDATYAAVWILTQRTRRRKLYSKRAINIDFEYKTIVIGF